MRGEQAHRRSAGSVLLAAASVGALLVGCASSTGPIDVFAGSGWLGARADAANSNATTVDGSRAVSLAWSRPLGAASSTPASIAPNGQIFVTVAPRTAPEGGDFVASCTLFSFESDTGRKRFCNTLGPSAVSSTPITDTVANVYAGDDSGIGSANEHGQQRWRTPVYGVPRAPQFLPDGNLLVVTQFGQMNVLSTQTGQPLAPIHDLIPPPAILEAPSTALRPADDGLATCLRGGPDCAVAASPAVDLDAATVYVVLWREGAIAPQLVALEYDSASPALTEVWSSDLLPASVTSSPVLSPDGSTIYLTDTDGTVRAFSADGGAPKWSYFVGHRASGAPAIAADGLIFPSGGDGSHLLALRDAGDRPEVAWERPDLVQLGQPALSGGNTGYAITGSESSGGSLSLVTFDTTTGESVDTDELPGSGGYAVGTAVGPNGDVLVSTALGELFAFH